jgi:hypothetical protein
LSALETVLIETPARSATSRMPTRFISVVPFCFPSRTWMPPARSVRLW